MHEESMVPSIQQRPTTSDQDSSQPPLRKRSGIEDLDEAPEHIQSAPRRPKDLPHARAAVTTTTTNEGFSGHDRSGPPLPVRKRISNNRLHSVDIEEPLNLAGPPEITFLGLLRREGVAIGELLPDDTAPETNINGNAPAPAIEKTLTNAPTQEVTIEPRAPRRLISEVTMSWDLMRQGDVDAESDADSDDDSDDDSGDDSDSHLDAEGRSADFVYVDGFSTDDYIDDAQLQLLLEQLQEEHKAEEAEQALQYVHSSIPSFQAPPRSQQQRRSQWQKQASERRICNMIRALEGGHELQKNAATDEDFNKLLVEQYQAFKQVRVQSNS